MYDFKENFIMIELFFNNDFGMVFLFIGINIIIYLDV